MFVKNYRQKRQACSLRACLSVILLVTSSVCAMSSVALELLGSISNTGEYTSNTLRTEENEIGEWIQVPKLELGVNQQSSAFTLAADYAFQKRTYHKDLVEDEVVATGTSSLYWPILARRLDFYINNGRTESTIEALAPQTRENRQIQSVTSVGSNFGFSPRGKDRLELSLSYSDSTTSESATHSVRNRVGLSYDFQLSAISSLLADFTYSELDYSGDFPGANTAQGSLSLSRNSDQLALNVTVGQNWYDRVGSERTSGGTYDIDVQWFALDDLQITFSAFYGIVDQSSNLDSQSNGILSTDPLSAIVENTGDNSAFIESRGRFIMMHLLGRTSLTYAGFWSKQDYLTDIDLDNYDQGYELGLTRRLTKTANISFDMEISDRDFTDLGESEKRKIFRLQFDQKFGRAMRFIWIADYTELISTAGNGYSEWTASFQLIYTFLDKK